MSAVNCTCVTGVQVWDWTDPNCPMHGEPTPVIATDGSLTGPLSHYLMTATGEVKALTATGVWKTMGNGMISYGVESIHHTANAAPEPEPEPEPTPPADMQKATDSFKALGKASLLTVADMQKWLETLTAKLPPYTYLDWQAGSEPEVKPLPEDKDGSKLVQQVQGKLMSIGCFPPVDTQVMPPVEEDPATAPCRVYWNGHSCGKPRIHVLPGHPAGPEHVCDVDGVAGDGVSGPCSKVTEDGTRYDWSEVSGEWELVGSVKVFGEDC